MCVHCAVHALLGTDCFLTTLGRVTVAVWFLLLLLMFCSSRLFNPLTEPAKIYNAVYRMHRTVMDCVQSE